MPRKVYCDDCLLMCKHFGSMHSDTFDDLARINSGGTHKAPKMCPRVFLGAEFEIAVQKKNDINIFDILKMFLIYNHLVETFAFNSL